MIRRLDVSKLEGAALDAAVAKVELAGDAGARKFRPSIDWKIAGPIIERERITLKVGISGDWLAAVINLKPARWEPGSTPLIAAMRAFVAAKESA